MKWTQFDPTDQTTWPAPGQWVVVSDWHDTYAVRMFDALILPTWWDEHGNDRGHEADRRFMQACGRVFPLRLWAPIPPPPLPEEA